MDESVKFTRNGTFLKQPYWDVFTYHKVHLWHVKLHDSYIYTIVQLSPESNFRTFHPP